MVGAVPGVPPEADRGLPILAAHWEPSIALLSGSFWLWYVSFGSAAPGLGAALLGVVVR